MNSKNTKKIKDEYENSLASRKIAKEYGLKKYSGMIGLNRRIEKLEKELKGYKKA